MIDLNISLGDILCFVTETELYSCYTVLEEHNRALHEKTGKGSDYLGWVDLPSTVRKSELDEICRTATGLKNEVEYVVVIGIGGSYLGSKAVIEALSDSFRHYISAKDFPKILFAGFNISEDYNYELLKFLNDKQYAILVISKSGTTTEPAVAFRLLKNQMEHQYGKDVAKRRIIAVTDAEKGTLKTLVKNEGYKSFYIPDNIGGRYSVLSPVGLLPIAVGGFDIYRLLDGARKMELATGPGIKAENNPSLLYAAARNILFRKNYIIEILANYNPKLHYLTEWWKQLFGESEGKKHTGIFPAGADYTADLHSMGQYIQEGRRNIFETTVSVKDSHISLTIPNDPENSDKLNFLAGKSLQEVTRIAELATSLAHVEGGVPNIRIEMPVLDEYHIGELIYFFEKACGLSGYMMGINPFDQPGVEAYKNNMFALLGKPGYEEIAKKIQKAGITGKK